MSRSSVLDWIALSLLPGMGSILAHRALERFPDPAEIAYRIPPSALLGLPGIGRGTLAAIREGRSGLRRRAAAEAREAGRRGIRVIPWGADDYPASLSELPDPPIVLYLRGSLPTGMVRIAVVGSRRPSPYGRRVAGGLAASLAERGVEVISGGARGIDACAHTGALEAGGRTVAVLGSGLLEPYPRENGDLFEKTAGNGALISEFPLNSGPRPENFPRRNRIISGLAAATVVVEAALRSGSLITARHALEQGREVMAVPGPVSSERSLGCHRLIQQGAKLVQCVDDIVDELAPMYRHAILPPRAAGETGPAPPTDPPGPDEAAVLALLDPVEPVHIDVLADRSPFGIARLLSILFDLEFRGAVEQIPGRYYLSRPSGGS